MVLWIAGSGSEEARLRSLAPDGVMFLGQRDDVTALLRAADFFVLSSSWEGMPLSVLEAMSEGVPVISTDVAGIADIISHGESGLVLPLCRRPSSIAAGIRSARAAWATPGSALFTLSGSRASMLMRTPTGACSAQRPEVPYPTRAKHGALSATMMTGQCGRHFLMRCHALAMAA